MKPTLRRSTRSAGSKKSYLERDDSPPRLFDLTSYNRVQGQRVATVHTTPPHNANPLKGNTKAQRGAAADASPFGTMCIISLEKSSDDIYSKDKTHMCHHIGLSLSGEAMLRLEKYLAMDPGTLSVNGRLMSSYMKRLYHNAYDIRDGFCFGIPLEVLFSLKTYFNRAHNPRPHPYHEAFPKNHFGTVDYYILPFNFREPITRRGLEGADDEVHKYPYSDLRVSSTAAPHAVLYNAGMKLHGLHIFDIDDIDYVHPLANGWSPTQIMVAREMFDLTVEVFKQKKPLEGKYLDAFNGLGKVEFDKFDDTMSNKDELDKIPDLRKLGDRDRSRKGSSKAGSKAGAPEAGGSRPAPSRKAASKTRSRKTLPSIADHEEGTDGQVVSGKRANDRKGKAPATRGGTSRGQKAKTNGSKDTVPVTANPSELT